MLVDRRRSELSDEILRFMSVSLTLSIEADWISGIQFSAESFFAPVSGWLAGIQLFIS